MEESNRLIADNLNHLLSIARDGEKGYKNAAENAKDQDLKTIFERYSTQRSTYVNELQDLIISIGGDPGETGGMAGALHRTWIDIKESLSGHDRHALLSSCESGEDAAKEAYTKFFGDNFQYQGGSSTTSPYTVTGGTNQNYESTGLDTGNGTDTSSQGFSNAGSAERKSNIDFTGSGYENSSDPDFNTNKRASSSTMSDMDMDTANSVSPNTSMPNESTSFAEQRSNLKDPETELSHKIYNTVRMQLDGIQHAHDTIKSLRDQAV